MTNNTKFSQFKDENAPIVRPKNASSLILVKYTDQEIKILLGRRSSKARFMPGAWVFPGGVLDRNDFKSQNSSKLDKKIISRLAVANKSKTADALAITAIRETAEETGLMLGKNTGTAVNNNFKNYNGLNSLYSAGLEPYIEKLYYLGRAITPTFSPIRFHARFFVADAKYLCGKIRTTNELTKIEWIPIKNATDLPMADVTEFMVNELLSINSNLSILSRRLNDRPMFTWKNGKRWIKRK